MAESKGPSQATQLVEMAAERYWFATSTTGEPFAVPVEGRGPYVARMLRGGRDSLRAELAEAYAAKHSRVPSSQAASDALLVCEGRARHGPRQDLALRVAQHNGRLVLDLGGDTGEAVIIAADGWELVERSPVLFWRTSLTGPLPHPARGGSLDELWKLLNVTKESRPLVLAYLIAALFAGLPHPILLFTGEQGTGKSTAARIVSSVVDASPAQLRCAPRDVEAWAVAAAGSWIVALDNVTTIADWLSDALCRAVTGDGMVRRRLYSNDDLSVLAFRRVVMLTAIDPGALKGDLAERLLPVELERIPPKQRRHDDELAADWSAAHPLVLGALLDLAADVLRVLPEVHLDTLPRMADFARIIAAVDKALGNDVPGALGTYLQLGGRLAAEVVEGDPVAVRVRDHALATGKWSGTAGDLLCVLTPDDDQERRRLGRDWPTTGAGMAGALRRAAPALRSLGVTVEYDGKARRRTWTIEPPRDEPQTSGMSGGVAPHAADQPKHAPQDVPLQAPLPQSGMDSGAPAQAADQQERHSATHATPPALPSGVPPLGYQLAPPADDDVPPDPDDDYRE